MIDFNHTVIALTLVSATVTSTAGCSPGATSRPWTVPRSPIAAAPLPARQPSSGVSTGAPQAALGMQAQVTKTVAVVPGELVITEIMTDPLLVSDAVGEYVEVVYLGRQRSAQLDFELVLPDGRRIPVTGKELARGQPNLWLIRSRAQRRLRLPNRYGRLELRAGNRLVDVAQWARNWPWPRRQAGVALCRRGPGSPGDWGRAWRRCRQSLRRIERGSPGVEPRITKWRARFRRRGEQTGRRSDRD